MIYQLLKPNVFFYDLQKKTSTVHLCNIIDIVKRRETFVQRHARKLSSQVEIMPKEYCQTRASSPFSFGFPRDKICARRSTCGDPVKDMNPHPSAALTIDDGFAVTLIGITDSKECNYDKDQEATVYTSITKHMNWIRATIGDNMCDEY